MNHHWNPTTRRYQDDQGNDVSPSQLRTWIDDYIDAEQDDLDSSVEKVIAGSLLLFTLFTVLQNKIRDMHTVSGLLAYGGEDQMNPRRWDRISEKVDKELAYLEAFQRAAEQSERTANVIADQVAAGVLSEAQLDREAIRSVVIDAIRSGANVETAVADVIEGEGAADIAASAIATVGEDAFDSMIWGELGSRARMYLDSAYGTYENSVKAREMDEGVLFGRRVTESDSHVCDDCENAASEEYVPLEDLLDIGDSICGPNCRCTIEFDYEGIEPLQIDREIYAPGFVLNVTSQ